MGGSGSKKQIVPCPTETKVPVARLIEAKQEPNTWLVAAEGDLKHLIDSFVFDLKTCAYWNEIIVKNWDIENIPPPTMYDMCYLSTEHFSHASEIMLSHALELGKFDWYLFGLRWSRARCCTDYFVAISPSVVNSILRRVCKAKNVEIFGIPELVSEYPHPITIQPKSKVSL